MRTTRATDARGVNICIFLIFRRMEKSMTMQHLLSSKCRFAGFSLVV
jgi:hypothetical protein